MGCPQCIPWQREESWLGPSAHSWSKLLAPLSLTAPPGPSLTDISPPPSLSKDEYLADLYHFATKEDSYANYFINVSPDWAPATQSQRPRRPPVSQWEGRAYSGGGRLSFPHSPLSPQLMEIQADYHRKSLSSLDTALAELKENHSQAGEDMGSPDPTLLTPMGSGMLRSLHSIPERQ